MSYVLVAHGTRKSAGVEMIGSLANRVAAKVGSPVHVAFVDVLGPTPAEVLRGMTGPAVVVPAFLSRGYHVNTDIPAHVAASGHSSVTVADALGPSPEVARVLADRLIESNWRPGDSVVLAAAGTSDSAARTDLHKMAAWVSALTSLRSVAAAPAALWWRHTCWRTVFFRIGYATAARTPYPIRWAATRRWCD
jgi:sirohydrochlorin ferrochelatase